jgi:hypothetical protein
MWRNHSISHNTIQSWECHEISMNTHLIIAGASRLANSLPSRYPLLAQRRSLPRWSADSAPLERLHLH